MDKIYSRKRLLIPKIKIGKVKSGIKWKKTNYSDADNNNIFKDKKFEKIVNRKLIKTAIIVFIAICIANRIIATIEPTMDVLCVDMAKSIATRISNEQATSVMEKYKYEDISNVVKDDEENIKMIQMNVVTVNAITSDVALKIQEGLDNYKSDEFSIKLGTFTRNKNIIR
ncbi:MAG: hypothetical protein IJ890_05980 [Clostridia bacterium]|nr:hypothetical protein [Clostridia bacterium]